MKRYFSILVFVGLAVAACEMRKVEVEKATEETTTEPPRYEAVVVPDHTEIKSPADLNQFHVLIRRLNKSRRKVLVSRTDITKDREYVFPERHPKDPPDAKWDKIGEIRSADEPLLDRSVEARHSYLYRIFELEADGSTPRYTTLEVTVKEDYLVEGIHKASGPDVINACARLYFRPGAELQISPYGIAFSCDELVVEGEARIRVAFAFDERGDTRTSGSVMIFAEKGSGHLILDLDHPVYQLSDAEVEAQFKKQPRSHLMPPAATIEVKYGNLKVTSLPRFSAISKTKRELKEFSTSTIELRQGFESHYLMQDKWIQKDALTGVFRRELGEGPEFIYLYPGSPISWHQLEWREENKNQFPLVRDSQEVPMGGATYSNGLLTLSVVRGKKISYRHLGSFDEDLPKSLWSLDRGLSLVHRLNKKFFPHELSPWVTFVSVDRMGSVEVLKPIAEATLQMMQALVEHSDAVSSYLRKYQRREFHIGGTLGRSPHVGPISTEVDPEDRILIFYEDHKGSLSDIIAAIKEGKMRPLELQQKLLDSPTP